MIVSCSSSPDDSTTNFSKSDKQEWRQAPTGKLNQFGNPEMRTEYYYQEWATIKPTWGQSFYFASRAGYTFWLVMGLVLITMVPYVIIKSKRDEPLLKIGKWKFDPLANQKHGGRNINIICFILLAAGGACIYLQPGNVKWRNYKSIDKAHYEKVVSENGSSKPIWDSLLTNGLIIGGPNKK
jgi:hypothetical protein